MNIKVLGLMAALALLGACSDKTASTGAASGTGAGGTATTGGAIPGSQEDLVANVGDRVFFAYDQSTLSSDAQATLDRQAGWLGRYPQVSVQLAGNCDERGTEEYNLSLVDRRAKAAIDYLVAQGIAPARMVTISYGKERPLCADHNEACWAKNRRAHFLVKRG